MRPPLRILPWRTALGAVLLASCGGDQPTQPVEPVPDDGSAYWPAESWRTASPAAVGLDPDRIDAAVARIRNGESPGVHSMLVIRYGYLAAETYANGSTANVVHTLQSVTKSVTSLLVGIARFRGADLDLARPVLEYFPEYPDIQNLDARKSAMTLRDLLTMRTGLDWSENPYNGSPLARLNNSRDDWLRLVLDWPMRDHPGTRWEYNSGGVIVLGGVIYNRTGEPADEFARRELFDRIGAGPATWYIGQPNGLPHLGGGLNLRARDLARVGYLVLRRGVWDGQQLVSGDWIQESTAPVVTRPRSFGGYPVDYGYLWWRFPLDGNGSTAGEDNAIVAAIGAGGQWILIVPRYDLLVTFTGNTSEDVALRLFYDYVLPAVHSTIE